MCPPTHTLVLDRSLDMLWVALFVAFLWLGIARGGVGRHSMLGRGHLHAGRGRLARQRAGSRADNKRLNDRVVANVYTVQHQAGCTNDVKINPRCGRPHNGGPTTLSTTVNSPA